MNASSLVYSVLAIITMGMLVGISFEMINDKTLRCSVSYFGVTFGITKAISTMINISLGLLLIQPLIRYIRIFFAISRHMIQSIHTGIGVIFVLLAMAHTSVNAYIMRVYPNANVVGTGVLLALVIAAMVASLLPSMRKRHYTTFVVMHYTTMILTVILLPIHANYCYFKYDNGSCMSNASGVLIWLLPVFLVPFLVTMTKYIPLIRRNRLEISNVTVYPMKVIKIRFKNVERQLGGKTVYIGKGRFPIEWHPYTFVDDETIIMKARGDWTSDLARSLGILFAGTSTEMVTPTSYPELIYDGGFKSVFRRRGAPAPRLRASGPCARMALRACPYRTKSLREGDEVPPGRDLVPSPEPPLDCKDAVYIATGIGITTFVHHIRTNDLQNCFMIIVVKKLKELTWLWEIGLGGKVIVLLFITGKDRASRSVELNRSLVDDLPGYVEQISFHRPDWRETLRRLEERGVGKVYYAGVDGVNLSKYTKMPVTEV